MQPDPAPAPCLSCRAFVVCDASIVVAPDAELGEPSRVPDLPEDITVTATRLSQHRLAVRLDVPPSGARPTSREVVLRASALRSLSLRVIVRAAEIGTGSASALAPLALVSVALSAAETEHDGGAVGMAWLVPAAAAASRLSRETGAQRDQERALRAAAIGAALRASGQPPGLRVCARRNDSGALALLATADELVAALAVAGRKGDALALSLARPASAVGNYSAASAGASIARAVAAAALLAQQRGDGWRRVAAHCSGPASAAWWADVAGFDHVSEAVIDTAHDVDADAVRLYAEVLRQCSTISATVRSDGDKGRLEVAAATPFPIGCLRVLLRAISDRTGDAPAHLTWCTLVRPVGYGGGAEQVCVVRAEAGRAAAATAVWVTCVGAELLDPIALPTLVV